MAKVSWEEKREALMYFSYKWNLKKHELYVPGSQISKNRRN